MQKGIMQTLHGIRPAAVHANQEYLCGKGTMMGSVAITFRLETKTIKKQLFLLLAESGLLDWQIIISGPYNQNNF